MMNIKMLTLILSLLFSLFCVFVSVNCELQRERIFVQITQKQFTEKIKERGFRQGLFAVCYQEKEYTAYPINCFDFLAEDEKKDFLNSSWAKVYVRQN